MCLGEVAQVVELRPGPSAVVRSRRLTATVSLLTLDEVVVPGDWVLCHSGFALGRLTAEQAGEAAAIRATTAAPVTTPVPTVASRKDMP